MQLLPFPPADQLVGYDADAAVRLLPTRMPTEAELHRRRLLAERAAAQAEADAAAAAASSPSARELVPYAGWTHGEWSDQRDVAHFGRRQDVDVAATLTEDVDAEDDDNDMAIDPGDHKAASRPRAHPEPGRYQRLTQLMPYAGGEKLLPGIAFSPSLVRQQQRRPPTQQQQSRGRRRHRLLSVDRPLVVGTDDASDSTSSASAAVTDTRLYMLLPDVLFDELKDLLPTVVSVTTPADGRPPPPPSSSSSTATSLTRRRSARLPLCDTVRQNGLELALLRIGDLVFACDLRCPHAGGPMNCGQLLASYNGDCLLRCPWHGYTFNLFADGEIYAPSSRQDLRLRMYPVKRDAFGRLYIGFQQLSAMWFAHTPAADLF